MTSMMDIIFLMLFFFITTSVFSQWEYEINITLPSAQSGKVPDRLPGEIIINITRDGRVSVNQQDLTLDALRARLDRLARYFPGQPVVLRADKETRYEDLIKVVDTCRKADIWNFSMATSEEKPAATETP
ncbi:MAG TPA: biopolymer transporter ExbD [Kiritimatiellia bacterium]|nr:biopolymer transporter ExbD [Kiritimatiellia bacterium]HOR97009.1 biopolymer transporter ExbD [Kiritimatiellia bacterium]HPK37200.1 biopolymer transporter ExbD [Kiritimatiellia bacterium]HPW75034.1 biopolymer transporter ExbD [Kiritimatiellia bacterium]HRU19836.1 biopolymer transporter ExbD [Kiritimatiellia bacterium]